MTHKRKEGRDQDGLKARLIAKKLMGRYLKSQSESIM